MVVYELILKVDKFYRNVIFKSLNKFKEIGNIIIINSINEELKDVEEKNLYEVFI